MNEGSIRLFKRLGFKESRYVEAFEEYHLIGEHNKSKVDKVEKYKMEMKWV